MTDLMLAILHHLLVFLLVAVLAAEIVLVRPGMDGAAVRRVASLDGLYGGLAGAVILVGFARVFLGLKGWEYYIYYWVFWAKVGAFAIVGVLSTAPTMRFQRWKKAAVEEGWLVPASEVAAVRAWFRWEAAVLVLVPIFAAMMARGVGY
ncbi:DUF2214 family protein [Aquamicrobium sp. LC103]|uniref:DUF2214 family protein n=1 Tax=Aquamicrobium sp. LC103 TaxID=1120658 RepID=UPI00063E9526|nr:DUF2214 family protein [Aquamicrobium sp. LC103]TKT82651.1 DUF2214 family protein [Aquamicrobium sp. LC103]